MDDLKWAQQQERYCRIEWYKCAKAVAENREEIKQLKRLLQEEKELRSKNNSDSGFSSIERLYNEALLTIYNLENELIEKKWEYFNQNKPNSL